MSQQPYQPESVRRQSNPYEDATVQNVQYGNAASVHNERQRYIDPQGNQVERREEIVVDKNQRNANIRYWIKSIVYFLLAVFEVIMALRLLFRFLGANQSNAFISFLYDLSHLFVGAFNGIFNDQTIGNTGVFEVSTVIAMLVYALIAWGLVSLGRVIFASTLSDRQTTFTRRSRQV
ncbi:hypothetical protein [Tengunoibacter tsumagoiensis]|uniref:YggT family protein n=1 Tax=Tengunoibacter tsumagoiensis TaxID=2014871 RepID=A0A402AA74_9CHLR|nr:hypothetical protein [Tengunoibacter tsumagoiensis]GCE16040.1 hypothetical protein KTT_58990 [Tengunoibacter tsumagoiensis]